ncbi:MAG: gfo/Idh/MocA family oxidoreductase, partial [Deltaproteobacteria bacterium]
AGKAVWLEKPLALTEEELAGIVALLEDPATPPVRAMVGFNRRYAPLTRWVTSRLKREGPAMMQIRVNAGPLPPDSWILDPVEGGGRIRGEVCHFVDLLHAFAASAPVRVFAEAPTSPPDALPQEVSVTIRFADGSIGTILYAACGDPEGGKEYIEIMADGAIAVIDDFRYASISRNGKKEQERLRHQDKGQSAQIEAFFQAIRENRSLSLTESIRSTLATLKIEDSLRTGAPILLGDPEGK